MCDDKKNNVNKLEIEKVTRLIATILDPEEISKFQESKN